MEPWWNKIPCGRPFDITQHFAEESLVAAKSQQSPTENGTVATLHSRHEKSPLRRASETTLSNQTRYVAEFNYNAKETDEIYLEKGDLLIVEEIGVDNWARGRNLTRHSRGTFPGNFVRIAEHLNTRELKPVYEVCALIFMRLLTRTRTRRLRWVSKLLMLSMLSGFVFLRMQVAPRSHFPLILITSAIQSSKLTLSFFF